MWPPNIVGAALLGALLCAFMIGFTIGNALEEWRDKHR